ncbi:MAG TPA: coenzyme F420-0:L-glutamate ligase [Nitrososphaeraceae archaeon]|jgi:coenzyme F420-0:L-glutamate ligase|nr:coenzyme F420-0:L-glutamate ligase [Nitrososphaeraceae archaeon]
MEIFPIKIPKKGEGFDLFRTIVGSKFQFLADDILVISSKFVSMSERSLIDLKNVKVSKKARALALKFKMDERIAQVTLQESDSVVSGIPGFLLTINDGMIAPNAGIDKSNCPQGKIVLYPKDSFKTANKLRKKFHKKYGIKIGIVISDSRLMPTRIGCTGIAVGVSGFDPVDDERGKTDLYGKKLKVTFRATADCLATIGVFMMGESNESIPLVVIRGANVRETERSLSMKDMTVNPKIDIYLRNIPFL